MFSAQQAVEILKPNFIQRNSNYVIYDGGRAESLTSYGQVARFLISSLQSAGKTLFTPIGTKWYSDNGLHPITRSQIESGKNLIRLTIRPPKSILPANVCTIAYTMIDTLRCNDEGFFGSERGVR